MYGDFSPQPQLIERVLVIEEGDDDIEDIIETARDEDAVRKNDDEIFYLVFANEPRRVWDFTEKSLRAHFKKKAAAHVTAQQEE